MNFEDLLKQQKSNSSQLGQILNAAKTEQKGGGFEKDERLWKPRVDKAGNGFAVVRFLPAPDSDLPWVKYYDHGFRGDGGWFIENCPTTLGKTCPVCEKNSALWNSGIESDKDVARSRKRRLHYVSNVLVLKDNNEAANEGKVFLYQFGKKIFDKLMEAMQPQFDDETPINPYNLFSGAAFKIKIRQVGGYWNYDSSEFSNPEPLFDGDEAALKKLFEQMHPIQEFVDPEKFQSYENLEKRFNRVMGVADVQAVTKAAEAGATEYTPGNTVETSSTNNVKATADTEGDEDDDMEYFKNLAAKYN